MTKWVYTFGNGQADGSSELSGLLGGKGANLAEMSKLGFAVPPGFTISTNLCRQYLGGQTDIPDELKEQVEAALAAVATISGKSFGDAENPLLVSVRSGARASMPGMMDTVLNLGLNDQTVEAFASQLGDARFAYDTYRRFVQMYGEVVLGVDPSLFEEVIDDLRATSGIEFDTDLGAEDWKQAITRFKQIIQAEAKKSFPQDARDQLWTAVCAVLKSWMSHRAVTYRALHKIPDDDGTAVTIQSMVFGNRGEKSASGVAFTRNPSTGENNIFGEYLLNAQGEDVVAGIRTPFFITERARISAGSSDPSLEKTLPSLFEEFAELLSKLESHYADMQDVEFTIEDGKLWLLQTRTGKRTTKSAIRIAVEMAEEGLISKETAVARLDPSALARMVNRVIDPDVEQDVYATGLPASPGAATGAIVFSSDEAIEARKAGKKVILVRKETSPHDIAGMDAAVGILTSGGGMTSHAAVVARSMGKPCVCGAMSLRIDYDAREISSLGKKFKAGDLITIDGTSGKVLVGELPLIKPEPTGDLAKIVEWARKI